MLWWIAPIGGVIALVFAWIFYKSMMAAPEGDQKMIEVAAYVREGANAYLRQQYRIVAIVFVILALIFAFMAYVLGVQNVFVPFAFLTGGLFSGLCGWLGMKTATWASSRTAEGAKTSLNKALTVAFRSGAVMGLIVVALGLIDICLWWQLLNWVYDNNIFGLATPMMGPGMVKGPEYEDMKLGQITTTMLTFGMGASTQALFARVGGGIFTKSADVGADLVGKVEAGIPEDDPRNPATIADNVGDNVGDVAGMGADLYESYCGAILATAVIAIPAGLGVIGIVAPMIIAGVGIIASILGIFLVRTEEKATQGELLKALSRGINASVIFIAIATFGITYLLFSGTSTSWLGMAGSVITGLVAGWIIGKSTEYYTSQQYKPTRGIADQARFGPATVIIAGLAVGMKATLIPVLTVGVAIVLSYAFAGGFSVDPRAVSLGLYGVSIAAVGMLATLGITLATDAYGPIADNAGGNAQMTNQEPYVRERTDALDALGNTTAATGKGFAIGSAALTALALLAAYIDEIKVALIRVTGNATDPVAAVAALKEIGVTVPADKVGNVSSWIHGLGLTDFVEMYGVSLFNPKVLVGMFVGSMMVFFFCSLTMEAVGRAAGKMVEEVRRQFREIAGLLEGKPGVKADYASCVAIATKGAQREMILPSLLAIIVPVLTGVVLGVCGVIGLLAGALATGFVVAIFMASAGGAWDNAKKYIEEGNYGGKGSLPHKAAVVGDTVGDPFKDTSGPSLNILIKLMSMISVVFAGLVVAYSPTVGKLLGLGMR
ncbi:MAG: sodium-translocating pyrophosphatase [Candidatus Brocadiia bacterium]